MDPKEQQVSAWLRGRYDRVARLAGDVDCTDQWLDWCNHNGIRRLAKDVEISRVAEAVNAKPVYLIACPMRCAPEWLVVPRDVKTADD